MQRHHFLKVTGLFAVVAGLISLSGIITTFDVFARSPRGNTPPGKFAFLAATQVSSSGYQRQIQQAWTPQNGVMQLGFAVLGEQTKYVKVSATPFGTNTKGLQYAFTIAVTDFLQVPLEFSAQNNQVLAAAQAAKGWSAQNSITVILEPAMQGKWITVYAFTRNGDGVAALAGYPQQIDDASAIVFQVPQATVKDASKAGVPITLYIPPAWNGVQNEQAPLPLNQIIGYVGVSTNYKEPIEIVGMKIGLDADKWDKGSVAVVRMPHVLNKASVMAAGEASQDSEPAIVALGMVDPLNTKCKNVDVLGVACVWPDESVTDFPFAAGVTAQPKKNLLLVFTIDDLAMTSSSLYVRVLAVDWRYVGEKNVYMWELEKPFGLSVAKFLPPYLYTSVTDKTPSGVTAPSGELIAMRFYLQLGPGAAQNTVVHGVRVSIASNEPIFGGNYCTINVTNVFGKSLGSMCAPDAKGGSAIVPFATPLVLKNGMLFEQQVVVNAKKANWNTKLQVTGVTPLTNVDGQWIDMLNSGPAVGKELIF